jgi:hypothetical protein
MVVHEELSLLHVGFYLQEAEFNRVELRAIRWEVYQPHPGFPTQPLDLAGAMDPSVIHHKY